MKRILTYTNLDNGGSIKLTKTKYDILAQVSLDGYGFEVYIDKEQLKELIGC